MTRIAPVHTAYNPKALWFDAGDLNLSVDQAVVVSTARGLEFGRLASEVFEAEPHQLKALKSPLRPVERIATEEDEQKAQAMHDRSLEALPVFKELVAESGADMRPVSVEFLLDGDKAVFYFESEDRVDFRELVRKLASRFHVRVDMRQIGVRDEARMIGGLGHCGQELCCKRLGGEFCPVSIRMAKEQDLSLNPQKISGLCGRLMCCLRYEFEAYKDFKGRSPKMGAAIETPEGEGRVVDLDVPREVVSVKVGAEKPVKVPLSSFDEPREGCARPCCVGTKAWEIASAQSKWTPLGSSAEPSNLASSLLTGEDKLGKPQAVRRTARNDKEEKGAKGTRENRRDREKDRGTGKRRGSQAVQGPKGPQPAEARGQQAPASASAPARKQRPRRSTKLGTGADEAATTRKVKGRPESKAKGRGEASAKTQPGKGPQHAKPSRQEQRGNAKANAEAAGAVRPGRKSSGLRNPARSQGASESASDAPKRRAPRRSHKSGSKPRDGAQG